MTKTKTSTTRSPSDHGTTDATPQANPDAEAQAPAPAAAPPARPIPDWANRPGLTRPWMAAWVVHATDTGNIETACASVGVSVAEVCHGRRDDPEFDLLGRVFEEVTDKRITNAVCRHAIDGEPKSLALYYARVRSVFLTPGPTGGDPGERLAPEEAEAAIRAALEVREARLRAEARDAPPAPLPSRPEPPGSRDSAAWGTNG